MTNTNRKFFVKAEDIDTGEKAEVTIIATDAGHAVQLFESMVHFDIVLVQRVDDLDEDKRNERALKRITSGMTPYNKQQVETLFNATQKK